MRIRTIQSNIPTVARVSLCTWTSWNIMRKLKVGGEIWTNEEKASRPDFSFANFPTAYPRLSPYVLNISFYSLYTGGVVRCGQLTISSCESSHSKHFKTVKIQVYTSYNQKLQHAYFDIRTADIQGIINNDTHCLCINWFRPTGPHARGSKVHYIL